MSQLRALVLVLSVGLLLFVPHAARAEKEMLAGHWRLDFYGKCVIVPDNRRACRYLLGPASFAAMNVRGAAISVRGIGDYVSDRSGHFSVHFSTWITERVPYRGVPARCDDATVFFTVFTGTCRETGSGHGHIAAGITGMPDFWEDDTSGSWSGPDHARFASTGATDTFNPACAGRYDTRRFLRLFGVHPVPSGITARVVLVHTR